MPDGCVASRAHPPAAPSRVAPEAPWPSIAARPTARRAGRSPTWPAVVTGAVTPASRRDRELPRDRAGPDAWPRRLDASVARRRSGAGRRRQPWSRRRRRARRATTRARAGGVGTGVRPGSVDAHDGRASDRPGLDHHWRHRRAELRRVRRRRRDHRDHRRQPAQRARASRCRTGRPDSLGQVLPRRAARRGRPGSPRPRRDGSYTPAEQVVVLYRISAPGEPTGVRPVRAWSTPTRSPPAPTSPAW